jgi:hypothetical protein
MSHATEPSGTEMAQAWVQNHRPPPAAPAQEPDFDPEALAAGIAARLEEVGQEIDADLDAFSQAETAFLVEADAGIAAERLWAQEHNPVALAAINGRLDDTGGVIAEMCALRGVRRAA